MTDLGDLYFAKRLATLAHHHQKYGDHPYTYHLEQVANTLLYFGFTDIKLQVAAWLHDIIEDTHINYYDIKYSFGEDIAQLVDAVTNSEGASRRERNKATYLKIAKDKEALILKLADRISNVEFSVLSGDLFKMYKKEWDGFLQALYDPSEEDERVNKMWAHLKRLFT